MPEKDGLQVITELISRGAPKPRIIVMTTYESEGDVRRALKAGAKGYLVKGADPQQIREAVRKVGALSRQQPHPAVGALGHDAEAVMLDFVNPFRTGGWAVRWTGEAGLDEVSRMGQGTFAHAICSTGIRRGPPRGWCDPGHRNRGLS